MNSFLVSYNNELLAEDLEERKLSQTMQEGKRGPDRWAELASPLYHQPDKKDGGRWPRRGLSPHIPYHQQGPRSFKEVLPETKKKGFGQMAHEGTLSSHIRQVSSSPLPWVGE